MIDPFKEPNIIRVGNANQKPNTTGGASQYKFEIPEFEGFTPARGSRSDCVKKVLTNQDALALIIDHLEWKSRTWILAPIGPTPSSAPFEVKKVAFGDIRQLARQWKKPLSMVAACSGAADWVGWYFNSSYGYVGNNFETLVCGDTSLCKSKNQATFWYRTRKGHYCLTRLGKMRVVALKKELREAGLVPGFEPASKSVETFETQPHRDHSVRYTRVGRLIAPVSKGTFTVELRVGMYATDIISTVTKAQLALTSSPKLPCTSHDSWRCCSSK